MTDLNNSNVDKPDTQPSADPGPSQRHDGTGQGDEKRNETRNETTDSQLNPIQDDSTNGRQPHGTTDKDHLTGDRANSRTAANSGQLGAGNNERSECKPKGETPSDDDLWSHFEQEHAQDLQDIAQSQNARRFEKQLRREKKKALLSVDDLNGDAFAHGNGQQRRGPRDFTGSSWLDTNHIMDSYGQDFVPPNPSLGHIDHTMLVFWLLLIVGVVGLIASIFLPALTSILGTVFGLCALIGGAGLLLRHRGFSQTKNGYFDDGSRV